MRLSPRSVIKRKSIKTPLIGRPKLVPFFGTRFFSGSVRFRSKRCFVFLLFYFCVFVFIVWVRLLFLTRKFLRNKLPQCWRIFLFNQFYRFGHYFFSCIYNYTTIVHEKCVWTNVTKRNTEFSNFIINSSQKIFRNYQKKTLYNFQFLQKISVSTKEIIFYKHFHFLQNFSVFI